MQEERVIIAGFGGQGVIFASKVLIQAGLTAGKTVVQFPSYGPEMRGGTANGIAVISDEEIYSPVTEHPSSVIIMSQPSLQKFVDDFPKDLSVKRGGLVVINTSIINKPPRRKDIQVIEIDAKRIAEKIGSGKVANMVALGAYLARKKILNWEDVFKGLKVYLSDDRVNKLKFFDINKKALEAGASEVN